MESLDLPPIITYSKPPPAVKIFSTVPGWEIREQMIRETRIQYKCKLKRHKNTVMALYTEKGADGVIMISGDAD
jgi:hypothetical protein